MHNIERSKLTALYVCFMLGTVAPCMAQTGSCAKVAGTWRIVSQSADGQATSDVGKTQTQIKHVTDTQFAWVTYNNETKQVTSALGGTCAIAGDSYIETPQYGLGQVLDLLRDKEQKFTWKLDGDRWHLKGQLSNGLKLEEEWERVKK